MRSWSFRPHQRERLPESFTHRPPQLQSACRPSGGRPLLHRGALSAQPGSRPDLSLASTRFPLGLRCFPRNWIHGFHRPSTPRPSCWLTSTCARRSTHPCPQEDRSAHIAPARRPLKTATPPEGHVTIPRPVTSPVGSPRLQSCSHPRGDDPCSTEAPLVHSAPNTSPTTSAASKRLPSFGGTALAPLQRHRRVSSPNTSLIDLRSFKASAILRGDSPCSTANS